VTVLPEGLDVEVMKTGGIGGLFFSIPNARFVHRQVLAAPRMGDAVRDAAPQIADKLVYLRAHGVETPARASGEIPSASAAVGAGPQLAQGTWTDDAHDRSWLAPTVRESYDQIDHFHEAPASRPAADRASWGEWHYFNVVSPSGDQWAFITLMLAGDVPRGEWGGQVLVTLHGRGRPARRFSTRIPRTAVHYDTTRADLDVGASTVRLTDDGHYRVHVVAPSEQGGAPITVDLEVAPAPRQYFPGANIASGELVSGYAVPALRGDAQGAICVGTMCERYDGAPAYHDHNWGLWRQVNWEWGAARAGSYAFLYGRVQPTDRDAASAPIFFYLTDSLGFRALFRPTNVKYEDTRAIVANGTRLMVPARALMTDIRGNDTLSVELVVDDAVATDTRKALVERGDRSGAAALAKPWFVQMHGAVHLRGRVGGAVIKADGAGFFETYR
jgi:hypothetical protein